MNYSCAFDSKIFAQTDIKIIINESGVRLFAVKWRRGPLYVFFFTFQICRDFSSESLKVELSEIIFQPLMLIYVNFVSMQREPTSLSCRG